MAIKKPNDDELKLKNYDIQIIKKEILRFLCDDFKNNQGIFDRDEGFQTFNGTDLSMVMDKVVNGLKSAQERINNNDSKKKR